MTDLRAKVEEALRATPDICEYCFDSPDGPPLYHGRHSFVPDYPAMAAAAVRVVVEAHQGTLRSFYGCSEHEGALSASCLMCSGRRQTLDQMIRALAPDSGADMPSRPPLPDIEGLCRGESLLTRTLARIVWENNTRLDALEAKVETWETGR